MSRFRELVTPPILRIVEADPQVCVTYAIDRLHSEGLRLMKSVYDQACKLATAQTNGYEPFKVIDAKGTRMIVLRARYDRDKCQFVKITNILHEYEHHNVWPLVQYAFDRIADLRIQDTAWVSGHSQSSARGNPEIALWKKVISSVVISSPLSSKEHAEWNPQIALCRPETG